MAENRSTDTKSAKSAKNCNNTGSNRASNSKDCHCNDGKSDSRSNTKKSGKKAD